MLKVEKKYECYHCNNCPTENEWNGASHYGDDKDTLLPNGVDGGLFDCPSCGEVVCGEDLTEI